MGRIERIGVEVGSTYSVVGRSSDQAGLLGWTRCNVSAGVRLGSNHPERVNLTVDSGHVASDCVDPAQTMMINGSTPCPMFKKCADCPSRKEIREPGRLIRALRWLGAAASDAIELSSQSDMRRLGHPFYWDEDSTTAPSFRSPSSNDPR